MHLCQELYLPVISRSLIFPVQESLNRSSSHSFMVTTSLISLDFRFNRSLTGSPLCLCLKSVESADHILHCEIASPVLLVARKSLQETCCELGVDFTIPMIINCRDKELLYALVAYFSEVLTIRSDFIDRDLRYYSWTVWFAFLERERDLESPSWRALPPLLKKV